MRVEDANRKCVDISKVRRILAFIFPQAKFSCRNHANLESRIDLCVTWRCCEMERLVEFIFRYEVCVSEDQHTESQRSCQGTRLPFSENCPGGAIIRFITLLSVDSHVVTRLFCVCVRASFIDVALHSVGQQLTYLSVGAGKPPMFGDYEAQRHWQEVTYNLPVSEWSVCSLLCLFIGASKTYNV